LDLDLDPHEMHCVRGSNIIENRVITVRLSLVC
jgi:hypothetical protein